MKTALPPLKSLFVFEVAAKYLSFTKASESLHVTPGAISRQIKQLEEYLGQPLFFRHQNDMELTNAGRSLLYYVCESMRLLRIGTQQIKSPYQQAEHMKIKVSTLPAFSYQWLAPRLTQMQEELNNITIEVISESRVINFDDDNFDVAIRFGKPNWRGMFYQEIIAGEYIPVCSPAMIADRKAIETANDLLHYNLLHSLEFDAWPLWFAAVGLKNTECYANNIFVFNDYMNVVEAAKAGQGIAIVNHTLAQNDLANGLLVCPLELKAKLPDVNGYIVCPEENLERYEVHTFIDWVTKQFGTVRQVQPELMQIM